MNIAVVLLHTSNTTQNEANIALIASRLTKVTVPAWTIDADGNQIPIIDEETGLQMQVFSHYVLGNLEHQIKLYQIIPYGVPRPSNMNLLISHNVLYGEGDNDKTGTHPRFFNWGMKRGTDYGADLVIYIENLSNLTTNNVRGGIEKFKNDVEFVEETFGKMVSLRCLKAIGQFKEDRSYTDAVTDYKARVVSGGLKNG